MLKILGRHSSINVRKVLWTCVELGLEPVVEPWGSGPLDLQAPEFLALNPNAQVPVLIDDDLVLLESNTICRYLAASRHDTTLLPADPRGRAGVEQWMDWQATELNPAWRYPFMSLVRGSAEHCDPMQLALGVAAWNRQMGILEARLQATRAFVCGDRFTLADVVLGLSAHRWLKTPIERPELPAVADWYQRLRERDGCQRHAPEDMA